MHVRHAKFVVPFALLALGGAPPAIGADLATSKPSCWKQIVNESFAGHVDRAYPVSCYRQALIQLANRDARYAEIRRALISAEKHARRGIVPAGVLRVAGRSPAPSTSE